MKKLWLLLIIVVAVVCIITPVLVSSQKQDFAGGSGTVNDPYLIETKEHLDHVRFYPYDSFKMIADIAFSEADFAKDGDFYNSGAGWEPIGYTTERFCGRFDGNHHTITNLVIRRDRDNIGLFGTLDSATISDLNLQNVTIEAKNNVGGIAGFAQWAHITHCSVEGTIRGIDHVGGLVGQSVESTKISGSRSAGSITGNNSVGGICGDVDPLVDRDFETHAKILSCYNIARVSGNSGVGGIVGKTNTTYASKKAADGSVAWYSPKVLQIENCFNNGKINGTGQYVAGILGKGILKPGPYSDPSRNVHLSMIKNTYNSGEITASAAEKGNIAGNDTGLQTRGCYYLEGCVTGEQTAFGTEKTHNQMQTKEFYEDWNFTSVWTMEGEPEYLYPELLEAMFEGVRGPNSNVVARGSCGTQVQWELTEDGLLDITGSGPMKNFFYVFETTETDVPWIEYAEDVRKIQIASGVTTIGSWSFRAMSNLTSVEIPGTVNEIGNSAFWLCGALPEITIPSSVHTIGGSAFYKCTSLKHLVLPNGITTISAKMCYQNTSLESITIPVSVTLIRSEAFRGCSSLKNVYYSGYGSAWDIITIEDNNIPLSKATYNFGTEIANNSAVIRHPKPVVTEAGGTATFTVETVGDVASYRWQYKKGSQWHDTTMAGFDTDTLTVDASGHRDGYEYRCVVTFADGTVLYTNTAKLTVTNTQTEGG